MAQQLKLKVLQNEHGEHVFNLPVSGEQIRLRNPKGKDLRAIDSKLKGQELGGIELTYFLAQQLCTSHDLSEAKLDDMDGEDLVALAGVINSFRAFSTAIK